MYQDRVRIKLIEIFILLFARTERTNFLDHQEKFIQSNEKFWNYMTFFK